MKIEIKLDKRLENLKNIKDARSSVGWYDNTKYDDNTLVGEIAELQEYGTSRFPPRPFMRPSRLKNEVKWRGIIEQGVKNCLNNGTPLKQAFGQVALVAQGDIAQEISEVWTPPLKWSTIRARMNRKSGKKTIGALNKPLIDTGTMIGTISMKVEDVE